MNEIWFNLQIACSHLPPLHWGRGGNDTPLPMILKSLYESAAVCILLCHVVIIQTICSWHVSQYASESFTSRHTSLCQYHFFIELLSKHWVFFISLTPQGDKAECEMPLIKQMCCWKTSQLHTPFSTHAHTSLRTPQVWRDGRLAPAGGAHN